MDIQIESPEDRKAWKSCFWFRIHCKKWSNMALLIELEKTIKLRKHSPFRTVKTSEKLDGAWFATRFNDVDIPGKDFSGSVKKFVKDYEHVFVMATILGLVVTCIKIDDKTGVVTYYQRHKDRLVEIKDESCAEEPTG